MNEEPLALKPSEFSSKEEDWPDWAFEVRTFSGAHHPRLLALMQSAENVGIDAERLKRTSLNEFDSRLSGQLFALVSTRLKGKVRNKAALAGPGEGFVLWRALVDEFESKRTTRIAGLRMQYYNFLFEGKDVISDFERFERFVKAFEDATGKPVDDESKVGIVTRNIADLRGMETLSEHIIMNQDRLNTYEAIKKEVNEVLLT